MGKRKGKRRSQKWVMIVLAMMLGAACAEIAVNYVEKIPKGGNYSGSMILEFVIIGLALVIGLYLNIILHEAGHLIFGLLSGYSFSSFRIGRFMWLKTDEGIRLRKFSLAGTGGQCLMEPPEMIDGKIPYKLYNLGGPIINIGLGAIAIAIGLLCPVGPFAAALLEEFGVCGVALGLMNGIPMYLGMANNDGRNALELGKDSQALRDFYLQLMINGEQGRGVRTKDMPDEWFELPPGVSLENSMEASIAVVACGRLIDMHRFKEAEAAISKLLDSASGMIGLHRNLLICDLVYLRLVLGCTKEQADRLLDNQQLKMMKALKSSPSVQRTWYAYALLAGGDRNTAAEVKKNFDKLTYEYPYTGEVELERELIAHADEVMKAREKRAVRGIIFDMDGTLWDSSEQVAEAWNGIFDRHPELGLRITGDDMRGLMGRTLSDIGVALMPELGREKSDVIIRECCDAEQAYLIEHGGRLYDGLEETLAALQKDFRLFIVSNAQDGYFQTFLDHYDFWKYFDDTECAGRTGKSRAENFRLVCERNGIERCWSVGDTQSDRDAALEVGTTFIYAAYGFGEVDGWDIRLDAVKDLPQIMKGVE